MTASPPRRWIRRLLTCLAIFMTWLSASIWIVRDEVIKPPELAVWWTDSASEPPPWQFRFVMFPPSDGLTLWDRPGGASIGTITRAVFSDLEEQGLDYVPVTDRGVSGFVKLKDLRWNAPPQEADSMMSALNREYLSRGPKGDEIRCRVELPPGENGDVRLEIWSQGVTRSTYRIDGQTATPLRFEAASEGAIGIAGAARVIVRVCIAVGLLIVAIALAVWVLVRKPNGRAAGPV